MSIPTHAIYGRTEVATTAYSTTGIAAMTSIERAAGAFGKITQLYGLATTGDLTAAANSGVHAAATPIFIEGQPQIEGVLGFEDQVDFGNTHAITLFHC